MLRTVAACVLMSVVASAQDGTFEDLASKAAAAKDANEVSDAVNYYRSALEIKPDWIEGWWSLGTLFYDSDQYAAAEDALSRVVRARSDAGPPLALLGLCEFETGKYELALQHIERSISLGRSPEPQMEQVLLYHEALLLTRTGQFDKALEKYAFFMRGGIPKQEILVSIGLATLRTPLLPKEVKPGEAEPYEAAGKAAYCRMTGNAPEAETAFRDLLRRFPNLPNVHYAYGLSVLANDPTQAVQEFKQELASSPENAAANGMLAWLLLRRNAIEEALPYGRRAADVDAHSAVAQFVYGRLLVESGSVNEGIERLQLAEKIDPSFLESHLSLATAYSRLGRMADANRERQISIDISKAGSFVAQH